MLSKVAERVYWLARYMERVENTARLARIHSQLMFDLPKSIKLNWYTLVQITSNEDYFEQFYDVKTEKNCMKMLLCDPDNPASLIASLWWARENTRTTRDILPREAWIHINELYLMVKDREEDFKTRSKRNKLLKEIIRSCQAWSGMLAGTMSQNDTYRFIKLGMSIERADMTSRLLDVGGLFIAQEALPDEEHAFYSVLWAHLLKSSSAYFMYRQKFQTEISGQQVIDFLIQDEDFARALLFNIGIIEHTALKLPNGDNLNPQIEALKAALLQSKDYQVGSLDLHNYLDRIQIKLSALHSEFYHLWFNPKEVA